MDGNLEALAASRTTPSALSEAPAPLSPLAWLLEALKRRARQHRDRRLVSHLDARTLKDIGLSREIDGEGLRYASTSDARR